MLVSLFATAQSDDELVVQQVIEYLLETSEEELDFTDLQQDLMGRLQQPLDINQAGFEDFKALGFITEPEILAILNHRSDFGDYIGIIELQSVEGLSIDRALLLKRFLTTSAAKIYTEDERTFKTKQDNSRGVFLLRYRTILQDQQGYALNDSDKTKGYLGSQYQLYNRVNYDYKGKISLGYTAEKDLGEEFFKGSQPNGFDFYSGHIYLKDLGVIKSVAIGDYQVQFGQGLTFWSGLAFGKSADVINVSRRPRKILPYRSVNENLFMRGAATTLGKGKSSMSLFYSSKNIDGNRVDDTLDAAESFFTSIQTSGFHRTVGEVADKNSVKEQIIGANIETKIKTITVGATSTTSQYDPSLAANTTPYQIHNFSGNQLSNSGVYYQGLLGRYYVFGETSVSDYNLNTLSTVNGLILSLSNKVDLATVFRSFAPQYNALYAVPFREQSRPQNEQGLYTGIQYKINQRFTLKAYLDRFRFKWLRFRTDLPSIGYEYLVELEYKPSKKFSIYGRYRGQLKESNRPDYDGPLDALSAHLNDHVRFQFRYQFSSSVLATTRAEWSTYRIDDNSPSRGILIFQELAFKPLEKPYSFIMRYAAFNIDDFNARIYTYEHDVLYAFSIPAYQNTGYRFYLLTKLKLFRKVDLWLRYGQTTFLDRQTVGSSSELINGSTRSELKAQLRVRF